MIFNVAVPLLFMSAVFTAAAAVVSLSPVAAVIPLVTVAELF